MHTIFEQSHRCGFVTNRFKGRSGNLPKQKSWGAGRSRRPCDERGAYSDPHSLMSDHSQTRPTTSIRSVSRGRFPFGLA